LMLSKKLDPIAHKFLRGAAALGEAPLETRQPPEARIFAANCLRAAAGCPEPTRSVEDLLIDGPAGQIPIRIFTPDAPEPRPALVYFHGGGWVVCDLDTHHVVCSALASRTVAVLVAVDYQLAPEYKFPAAVIEAYAATGWDASHIARLVVNPARLCV